MLGVSVLLTERRHTEVTSRIQPYAECALCVEQETASRTRRGGRWGMESLPDSNPSFEKEKRMAGLSDSNLLQSEWRGRRDLPDSHLNIE